ncbi:helix-turn-helix transcriptional regulator [bacterium]|nr:helix-turn-helix transcriptional regulator [bacterium]
MYEKELNVTKLASLTGKKITTVSKHLRLLHELDIVSFRTDENRVYYRLKKTDIVEVIDLGIRCMERR